MPAFEQRLALDLVEIGVVGLAMDEGVDLGQGGMDIAVTLSRYRSGVARW